MHRDSDGPRAGSDRNQHVDCLSVSPTAVSGIEAVFRKPGFHLERAVAVASGGSEQGYFVSARIRGPGITDNDFVTGTWLSSTIDKSPTRVIPVSATARKFSVRRGPAAASDLGIGSFGAGESQDCFWRYPDAQTLSQTKDD